jgi:hypothetical protein
MLATETKTPAFKDSTGHEWRLALSIGLARQIKNELGVDFGRIEDGRVFAELGADPYTLAQVLWLFVESQATAAGVTPETFAESLDGDALERATEAVLGAVVLFTPPRMRGPLKDLIAATKAAQDAGAEQLTRWLAVEGGRLADEVRTKTAAALGELLPSLPALSA